MCDEHSHTMCTPAQHTCTCCSQLHHGNCSQEMFKGTLETANNTHQSKKTPAPPLSTKPSLTFDHASTIFIILQACTIPLLGDLFLFHCDF